MKTFQPKLWLYILAGGAFFLFWMMVVFPSDSLKSRVLTEIENRTGGRYQLDMEEMDISLLGGATLEKLKVHQKTPEGKTLLFTTPNLDLDFSPFGMLSGEIDFDFTVEGNKQGEIEGFLKKEEGVTELEAEFDEYPLADVAWIKSKAKVGLDGSLGGNVELKLDPKNTQANQGNIDLQLENVATQPGSISLDPSDPNAALPLPVIKLSGEEGSHIKAKVEKDKLKVSSIKLTGGDVELSLQGDITLRGRSARDYRLNLKGDMQLSETLNQALPFLFILEKQKNAQGVYPLRITGRISRPNIRIGKFRVPI